MKTIVNILSWVSFILIASTICLASLYGGVCVCNYLHDLWHMSGWEGLVLVPIMLLVAMAICFFLMLGMKRISENYHC